MIQPNAPRPLQPLQGLDAALVGSLGRSALRLASSRRAKKLLSCIGQDRANKLVPLADPSQGAVLNAWRQLPVDPGKACGANEVEAREVKRIPVRRRRQVSDAQFRRVRRQTSFSPGDMASIARRSPNGRRGSPYPTSEWVRTPAPRFSRARMRRSSSLQRLRRFLARGHWRADHSRPWQEPKAVRQGIFREQKLAPSMTEVGSHMLYRGSLGDVVTQDACVVTNYW